VEVLELIPCFLFEEFFNIIGGDLIGADHIIGKQPTLVKILPLLTILIAFVIENVEVSIMFRD